MLMSWLWLVPHRSMLQLLGHTLTSVLMLALPLTMLWSCMRAAFPIVTFWYRIEMYIFSSPASAITWNQACLAC